MLGISFDTPEENKAFADANGFPFRLLSDEGRTVGAAYETLKASEEPFPDWPKRRTYLIGPEGNIRKSYRVKDVMAHPDEVLADLHSMKE